MNRRKFLGRTLSLAGATLLLIDDATAFVSSDPDAPYGLNYWSSSCPTPVPALSSPGRGQQRARRSRICCPG